MSENLNATCAICGTKYHVCNTCRNTKSLTPWRTVTDTIDCYKIYSTIHGYSTGHLSKETAKEELASEKMPETLQEHIKAVIDEINSVDESEAKKLTSVKKTSTRKTNNNNEQ